MASEKKEYALTWIGSAKTDLFVANENSVRHSEFWSTSIYHSQQAAEKALKALVILIELKIPKTHDLDKIIVLIEKEDFFNTKLYTLVRNFDGLDIGIRYPDFDIELTEIEVRMARTAAISIVAIAFEIIENQD